jgi:hypothetical protein
MGHPLMPSVPKLRFGLLDMSMKIATKCHWRLLSFVSFCCFICTTSEPDIRGTSRLQAAEPLVLRRWAVISDEPVRTSGVSDLLTAELSKIPHLELVERDDLAAVLRELEIDNLFGTRSSNARLQLGQTLKADVLLLLKQVDRDGASFLQWTIAECSLGARLRSNVAVLDRNQQERKVLQIVDDVQNTRERFSNGVEQLIAVSPFLSQDLQHDHDQLQHGLATILSESLQAFPGVAVLEIDEARLIAAERELGTQPEEIGKSGRPRIRRLFISGSYSTATADSAATPRSTATAVALTSKPPSDLPNGSTNESPIQVRVELAMTDEHDQTQQRIVLEDSLDGVLKHFRTETAGQLLKQGRSLQAPVLTAAQQQLLADRSQLFSQLGAWSQSIPLREASLLLKSDDEVLRTALIADIRLLMSYHFRETLRDTSLNRLTRRADQLALFHRAAPHIEWLIRHRSLSIEDASNLIFETCLRLRHHCQLGSDEAKQAIDSLFWNSARSLAMLGTEIARPEIVGDLIRAKNLPAATADQQLFRSLSEVRTRDQQIDYLTYAALSLVLDISPHASAFFDNKQSGRQMPVDDRRSLEDLYRVLTEVIPQDEPRYAVIKTLVGVTPQDLITAVRLQRFSTGQFAAFLNRLRETDSPVLRFYGDCGELAMRAHLDTQCSDASTAELAQRIDAEIKKWPTNLAVTHTGGRMIADLNLRMAARDRMRLVAGSKGQSNASALQHAARVKRWANECPIPLKDPQSKVRFVPIAGPAPDWWEIIPVRQANDQKLDIVWSRYAVSLMREPGRLDTIFELDKPAPGPPQHLHAAADELIRSLDEELNPLPDNVNAILDVGSDGELVWIATTKSGIRTVSLKDGQQWQIEAAVGLPEYTTSRYPDSQGQLRSPVLLHPLPGGSCLAIGKQGKYERLWFAWIQLPARNADAEASAKPTVELIHTATLLPGSSSSGEDDRHEIFKPSWIIERTDDTGHQTLIVNRAQRRPLIIDVRDRSISVLPAALPSPGLSEYHPVVAGNRLLIPQGLELQSFPIPDRSSPSWQPEVLYKGLHFEGGVLKRAPHYLRESLLQTGDVAWCPGEFWLRVDLRDGTVTRLNEEPLRLRDRFEHYGVSAHYGLVAWYRGDRLYRVVTEEHSPQADDLAPAPGDPQTSSSDPVQPEVAQPEIDQPTADTLFSFVPAGSRLRHSRAVQELEQLGAHTDSVWWRGRGPNGPTVYLKSGRSFIERKWFTVLWLDENWLGGDDGLRHLLDLHGPLVVYMVDAPITDLGMATLGRLGVTGDTDLEPPPGRVNYSRSRIAPSGSGLTFLHLYGTQVTDRGLAELRNLSYLRLLTLDATDDPTRLTDAGFVPLAESLPLERITLRGGGFSDASLQPLVESSTLHVLNLFQTSTTPAGWQVLKQERPWIQIQEH